MDINEIADAIVGGGLDDSFDQLEAAIKVRRKIVANRQLHELKPGDRVRVSGGIRPKYLVGAVGTVKGVVGQRIEVYLDKQVGRYSQELKFPAGTLEVI